MVFAWCRLASKLASVCGRFRSISAVVSLAPPRPLVSRGFLSSTAIDDRQSSNQMFLYMPCSGFIPPKVDDEPTPGINPYTIEDDGGKTVTLTRDYQEEYIVVVAGMPYEEYDGLCFPLTVNFTKKISGLSLEFRCTAFPLNGTSMNGVSVISRGNYWEDQRPCDLNVDYRHSYLRMIFDYSPKFALYKYMTTGTRKYVVWLKHLKKFLEE
ncbi:Mitochondrial glycoprotein superfamily [Arabidopsis suecica]|uniref:Mitochondrial glycoprotein superfamily n=1 Tax=Arabidopsis suecica TaxID=45249 RepID=A0A8T2G755_ARASU|nr:Mitochondrial glycoprotein superfamily [Arabidopsis suecica]